jgi:hypothetical protein
MECGFRGRQREDEPAVAGINGLEAEDVAEKRAIGFGVPGEECDVRA